MVGGRFEGIEVTLLNASPGENWYFVRHTFDLMLTKAQGLMICGGDLNVRLSPKLDSSRGSSPQDSSLSKKINSVLQDSSIIFPSPYSYLFFNRLLINVDVLDHCLGQMEIHLNFKRTILSWRLNASILNGMMKEEMKEEIGKYLEGNDNDKVPPPLGYLQSRATRENYY